MTSSIRCKQHLLVFFLFLSLSSKGKRLISSFLEFNNGQADLNLLSNYSTTCYFYSSPTNRSSLFGLFFQSTTFIFHLSDLLQYTENNSSSSSSNDTHRFYSTKISRDNLSTSITIYQSLENRQQTHDDDLVVIISTINLL